MSGKIIAVDVGGTSTDRSLEAGIVATLAVVILPSSTPRLSYAVLGRMTGSL